MGLSQRGYAAHRKSKGLSGQSHTAVRKALATGRISALPDGSIDPASADRQWAAETDVALQRTEVAAAPSSATVATPAASVDEEKQPVDDRQPIPRRAIDELKEVLREAGESDDPEEGDGITYMRARQATEILKGLRANEALKRERKEVVDRGRATSLFFDLARRDRDSWLAWPARIAAEMAAELGVNPHALETAMNRHLRAHLAALGAAAIDLTTAAGRDGR